MPAQRVDIADDLEAMVEAHPLYPVLTSMPGAAVRTDAIFIAETSGKNFASAAAMASYASLAPTMRQPGISIKSEHVSHAGIKSPKRASFLCAFAPIRFDPARRDYYDRKRGQGKRHNQALIALAHRRLTALFVMLSNGSLNDIPEQNSLTQNIRHPQLQSWSKAPEPAGRIVKK